MTNSPIDFLWSANWNDWRDPALLWQLGTLAACIVFAWFMARTLRPRFAKSDAHMRVLRLGVESFSRVLSPVIALILIAIATPVLATWQSVALMKLAIPLAGSFALIRLGFYVLRRIFARGGKAGNLLLMFEKLFAAVVWIGVALYILGLWPEMMQALESTQLPIGRYKVSVLTILQAGASAAITLILALWAGAMLEDRLMRVDNLHTSLRVVMARMGRACLVLVAVLISLSLVGIDLTVLSVFGGALGVGLGLGLQKLVSNYVSGFVILIERSLTIGDVVTVDKYHGQVTRINTRYTILRGLDGVETVIPNEMLVAGPVQNYSLTDRRLRLSTQITIGYRTDIERVLRLLEAAAASVPRVNKEPAPEALLVKFSIEGLDLEVGFWLDDPEKGRLNLVSAVNQAIWQALQANGIKVPSPPRESRLIDQIDATASIDSVRSLDTSPFEKR